MPKLGWVMEKGTILSWLKKEGEPVKKGEPLCEVEAEKVTTAIESPTSGILARIVRVAGSTVSIFEPIAIVANLGEEVSDVDVSATEEKTVAEPAKQVEVPEVRRATRERVRISPAARRLADQHNIDVSKLVGTGPHGMIMRKDILQAAEQVAGPSTLPPPGERAKIIPLTGTRRTIAERMTHSQKTIPQVTVTVDADMTETVKLRETVGPEIERTSKVELSYTDILVKAVATALRAQPIFNSTLEDDKIIILDEINIGIAVSTENGLIVPVIRMADKKSLADIAVLRKDLAERARQNRLTLDEISGGTFTLSNLGMFGADSFAPIVNPPQCAILGVGRIVKKAVVQGDRIEPRPIISLSLTFDHRIVDGASAAQFLAKVKEVLENPHAMSQPYLMHTT
jgi:pyruvate dehydrogenase E2 component (dihydrolipoamide acetyltransferase)